jgi:hypothetical protein
MAFGHFSDIGFVSAGKKRGFCRLRLWCTRKSDKLLVGPPAKPEPLLTGPPNCWQTPASSCDPELRRKIAR